MNLKISIFIISVSLASVDIIISYLYIYKCSYDALIDLEHFNEFHSYPHSYYSMDGITKLIKCLQYELSPCFQ